MNTGDLPMRFYRVQWRCGITPEKLQRTEQIGPRFKKEETTSPPFPHALQFNNSEVFM
jgi:hypothetical protein